MDIDKRAHVSPFRDLIGLRVVEWEEGRCVVEVPITTRLTNHMGGVADPVIVSAIDMAGVLAGTFRPEPHPPLKATTIALTTSFVSTSDNQESILATAIKMGGGKKIYTSTVNVTTLSGQLLAVGQCNCRYINT